MVAELRQVLGQAIASLEQRRLEDAEAGCRQVLQHDPKNAQAWNIMGALAMERRQYGDAVQYFHQAFLQRQNDPAVITNMGTAFLENGQQDKAEICFRQALSFNVSHSPALEGAGRVALLQEDFKQAEQYFSQALACEPQSPVLMQRMAECCRQQRDIAGAEAWYRKALSIAPGHVGIVQNLGAALNDQGKAEDAAATYASVLTPEHMPAGIVLNYLTSLFILRRFDVLEHAVQQFAAGAATESDKAQAWVTLAMAQYQNGQWEAAAKSLSLASAIVESGSSSANARSLQVYYRYFERLLEYRQTHPEIYDEASTAPLLHIVGDSHVLALAGVKTTWRGKPHRCQAHLAPGPKAWHLGRETPNHYQVAAQNALQAVPEGSDVLISFGEIDCRIDEGIYPYCQKHPEINMPEAVAELVQRYVQFIHHEAKGRGLHVTFLNVPASARPAPGKSEVECKALDTVIRTFNTCLRKEAKHAGVGVIDVYAVTTDAEGHVRAERYLDGTHLLPHIMAAALAEWNEGKTDGQ
ncbi:MAG: tetratricopeptide repeat protein [Hyphomicrobiales bacterium]|nr:tetratricopeptide repeat protein [Rickettsiales bacterium]MCP5361303.1 tetratricopeptide repeat protein [Hyphomicrobiales bacterium]